MSAVLAPIRLAEILHVARAQGASDVHISGGTSPVLRVDGSLQVQDGLITDADEIDAITASVLSADALKCLHSRGDVTAGYRDLEHGSIRIHAYRTVLGTSLAIRVLAHSVPDLDTLCLPGILASLIDRPAGLVLFAGPTGSGKSTALAALVDRINQSRSKHIITIEDPIEYTHVSKRSIISQRQIGTDVSSFGDAIYGALRSDPDVILIGEMRDNATMLAALTAAETGHLVLSTLHTADAAQTVDRIVGAFTGEMQEQVRVLLAQTIAAVFSTRLVPRAASRGRRCAAEVLIANDAVRNLIRDGKTHQLRNVISTSRNAGMQTLEAHLSELVARREITMEAAKAASERSSDVRSIEHVTG